jgi:hypothetical protein
MPNIEHNMLSKGKKDIDFEQQYQTEHVVDDVTDEIYDDLPFSNDDEEPFVDDFSDDDAWIEQESKKKNTLEKLLLFKKPYCKEVEIDGVTFKLKLLNSNESNLVYKEIMKLSSEEQLSKSSLMLLSASLIEADGIALEDTYSGPDDITSPIIQRYYELSQWHAPIINLLVKAYKDFSSSFLDKSPKTPTTG